MIVQAALSLLAQEGPNVTTLQIARAAGISEPTIFRAFADKNEVLAACLEEAIKPENVAIELEAIDLQAGLDERMTALIERLRTQAERTLTILMAIRIAAPVKPRGAPAEAEQHRRRWHETYEAVHAAVCRVLQPDEARLRVPVAEMATLLLRIVPSFGRSGGWNAGQPTVTAQQLADILLHGAVQ